MAFVDHCVLATFVWFQFNTDSLTRNEFVVSATGILTFSVIYYNLFIILDTPSPKFKHFYKLQLSSNNAKNILSLSWQILKYAPPGRNTVEWPFNWGLRFSFRNPEIFPIIESNPANNSNAPIFKKLQISVLSQPKTKQKFYSENKYKPRVVNGTHSNNKFNWRLSSSKQEYFCELEIFKSSSIIEHQNNQQTVSLIMHFLTFALYISLSFDQRSQQFIINFNEFIHFTLANFCLKILVCL